MKLKLNKKAQHALEFMVVTTLFLAAVLFFAKYFNRAFSGRWKSVGDSLGDSVLYDPHKTVMCEYDDRFYLGWYSVECFEGARCPERCFPYDADASDCQACIQSCVDTAGRCRIGGE